MRITEIDKQFEQYSKYRLAKWPVYFPRIHCEMVCLVNWSGLHKIMHHPDVRYFSIKPNINVNGVNLFAVGFPSKDAKITGYEVKVKYLTK
tara:strand:- start:96 stop:368 length:273 start_codon:yes stop_codon:yes gene_type:complete